MVSTRQMATNNGQSSGNEESIAGVATLPLRAAVVTRQCSNQSSNVIVTRHQHATKGAISTTTSTTAISNCTNNSGGSNSSGTLVAYTAPLHLHDLPLEILAKILSYESYKRIAQLRLVSHKINEVCMDMLNSTFSKLIQQTYNRFHAIKANMPRRESLRRKHPLACECDIIETCYMRLSLLQMTLGKHIERAHCCFFPGSILDEVYSILNHIKNTPHLERPYRLTDELFDLSTMAMEYFRDRIEPTLPGIGYFRKDFCRPVLVVNAELPESSANSPSPPQSNMVLRKGIRKIKQGMKIYNNQLSVLRNELRTCKRKSTEQSKQISEQQQLFAEQQKQALEYANRLDENEKKNEEMARKFSTLLQELNKCKTELQYWRSKSPAMPICNSCGQKTISNVLPPEDYQAFINQDIKPEDIIVNLQEDNDNESDNSAGSVAKLLTVNAEFAFPDELTTAKLLAVHSASKHLKRQYSATIAAHVNSAISCKTEQLVANEPCEMTNCLSMVDGTGIAIVRSAPMPNNYNNNSNNHNTLNENDIKLACMGFAPNLFYGNTLGCTPGETTTMEQLQQQQQQEQFLGSQHGGVIVSPSVKSMEELIMQQENCVGSNATTLAAATAASSCDMPSETKKARRVQKATRCLSASSKRSK